MAETAELHPDQEIVYTVAIRRTFEQEPPHDGTSADAMTEFERELLERLPGWKVRVFARGLYKPPTEDVILELELLTIQINRGQRASDKKFRKLMFLVGLLRDRLDELGDKDRKNAQRALNKVKKMLGLA